MAKRPLFIDPAQILAFPFQDQDWQKKILIASLLVFFSFIPVIPLVLLLGYASEIIRRTAVDRVSPALPEWDNFSDYFTDGFRLFGIGLVYMLPATLLIGIGYLGMFIPVFISELGGMAESQAFGMIIAGYLVGIVFIGVGALVSMLTGLILPLAGVHAIATGEFMSAFKFNEIWSLFKANWGGFITAFLILIGTAIVFYFGTYFLIVTVILCCLLPFISSFLTAYILLIGAGFFGNAYRIASESIQK